MHPDSVEKVKSPIQFAFKELISTLKHYLPPTPLTKIVLSHLQESWHWVCVILHQMEDKDARGDDSF